MKARIKKLFFLLILSFAVYSVPAQKVFIRVGGGYNLPLVPQLMGVNTNEILFINTTSRTSQNVYGSYGQSANLGLRVGYMFTDNIGVDLGLNHHWGKEQEIQNIKRKEYSDAMLTNDTTLRSVVNSFTINPSFILSLNQNKTIVPYLRFGTVIGVASFDRLRSEYYNRAMGQDVSGFRTDYEVKTTGKIGIGITGSFGTDIHIDEVLGLYGELHMLIMNYKLEPEKNFNYNFIGLNVGVKLRF